MATRKRLRVLLPILASVAILAPLGWLWQASLLPNSYSAMDMGYLDLGGGPGAGHDQSSGHHGTVPEARSLVDFTADEERAADVRVDLVAAQAALTIGGKSVDGYTLNGTSPGPTITAHQGELIEVRLRNASVSAGITLHWHGYDVPAAMDGVAGVTQDEVPVGAEFTYRFVADQIGTYWYHSHQVAHEQVIGGLFGTLVVLPKGAKPGSADVLATAHTYGGIKTINGVPGDLRVPAKAGQRVRVRVINTDNGSIEAWASAPYKLLAVDGHDVNQPSEVINQSVTLTGGARADLEVTMPSDGSPVRVQVSKGTAVILGEGDIAPPPQPSGDLNLLGYGSPDPRGLGFDPAKADRRFDYSIGRRPGFVKGRPGLWWTINGHLYPNVPMYFVRESDVVIMRIDNHSGDVHPMHLHGHHAVVLARNGVPATGSPWWIDSLNVRDKETFDIAFVANNPGLWMDHCHDLQHAADGMVAHLMYDGVTTPFQIGGAADNQPE